MGIRPMYIVSLAFFCLLSFVGNKCLAKKELDERRILVGMRMIGHEILMSKGDSTSRVLPIKKEGNRYLISFEQEFAFYPSDIIETVDWIMQKTGIANRYLVEMEDCQSEIVAYSYEVENSADSSHIPCRTRPQPTGCYTLAITLLDSYNLIPYLQSSNDELPYPFGATYQNSSKKSTTETIFPYLLLALLLATGGLFFFWKQTRKVKVDPNMLSIGAYQFDPRTMELYFQKEKTELTSKEADLLLLLYKSANTTLKRERLLQSVWGDEGDYVGRTLDVFISKLRKKLAADSSLKIVNIRGIGYKFVMSAPN